VSGRLIMHGSQTSTAALPPCLTREAGRAMRWAWVSLCLLPVSSVGAMVLGDWLQGAPSSERGFLSLVASGS